MPWQPQPHNYGDWRETCDTLHAHTQVLGKLEVALAPPQPELFHAALVITARGWETHALPAPDGSGSIVAGLDLRRHEAFVEHSEGGERRIPLTPDRAVGDVTRDVLGTVNELAGEVEINATPQEVPWTVPLDEDQEHTRYDPEQVATYFDAVTRAALVLAELRAPYRGRSSPVNAWWGSFDLAVNFFSGEPADPPSDDFIMRNSMDAQDITVGWWPGDPRYEKAAFYSYAHPAPDDYAGATLSPAGVHWSGEMGLYLFDWDDFIASPDPHAAALEFGRAAIRHGCAVCEWDPALAAAANGEVPPIS